GTVNGGIWKTTNATSANISWTPLTDNVPSLSIGDLEMDPTDLTHQTLIAGIGAVSNDARISGALNGVLYTTNGGTTWSQLGTTDLAGTSIRAVEARGSVLLVGAVNTDYRNSLSGGAGLYRSTNGGANFTLVSGSNGLPAGTVFDIAADPANSNR